jgi:hypothetical protein
MEYTGCSFTKSKNLLKDIEITYTPKVEKKKGKLILPKGIVGLKSVHKRYLKNRGFNVDEITDLWQLKGIGLSSKLPWRIFIPIYYHGKVVSWTTRSVSTKKGVLRSISAAPEEESIAHNSLLYGADFARDTIIIHEGPTDVWKTGPGAVATLGTNYSMEQISKMITFRKRIVCFDSDPLAQERANKLADDLSVFPGETFNIQLDAADAGSASKKEIRLLRKELLR